MKILATSDLHIGYNGSETLECLKNIISKEHPDVLVISGDVYDYRGINPFYELHKLGDDLQVIFCLGNHEFAYRDVEMVYDHYKFNDRFENVHCLDIKHYIDIDNIRFTGNVLWYDGSLSDRIDKHEKLKNIDKTWLDSTIYNFDPIVENNKCIQNIKNSLENYKDKSVLITHTVPYWKLNLFSYDMPNGVYNIYSGVKDLFHDHNINVDIAICGHTHRKTRVEYNQDGKYIQCYNIGNEYFEKSGKIEYEVIEI